MISEIDRLTIKAAKKTATTFSAFDLADFLADYDEERKTPTLWQLSRAEIAPLFFKRIENGLAAAFLTWSENHELSENQ